MITYTNYYSVSSSIPFPKYFLGIQQHSVHKPFHIHSEKICICSNSLGDIFESKSIHSNGCVISSQKLPNLSYSLSALLQKYLHPFEQFGHSLTKIIHPFKWPVPSDQKNCPSIRTVVAPVQKNLHPFEQLGRLFRKIVYLFKISISGNFIQTPWIIINFMLFR